jgi:hypothetical protein
MSGMRFSMLVVFCPPRNAPAVTALSPSEVT